MEYPAGKYLEGVHKDDKYFRNEAKLKMRKDKPLHSFFGGITCVCVHQSVLRHKTKQTS